MSARAALSSRSSPSLLVAFFLSSLSFPAFAQLSNKLLSLSTPIFFPAMAHKRASRTLFKVVDFASLALLFSSLSFPAFAQLSNKCLPPCLSPPQSPPRRFTISCLKPSIHRTAPGNVECRGLIWCQHCRLPCLQHLRKCLPMIEGGQGPPKKKPRTNMAYKFQ